MNSSIGQGTIVGRLVGVVDGKLVERLVGIVDDSFVGSELG